MEKPAKEITKPCPFLLKFTLFICASGALMFILFPRTTNSSPQTMAYWAGTAIGYSIPVITLIACLQLLRRRRWAWRVIQLILIIPLLIGIVTLNAKDLFAGGAIAAITWIWLLMFAVTPISMVLYLQFSKKVREYIESK